jgi:hypothetical protein
MLNINIPKNMISLLLFLPLISNANDELSLSKSFRCNFSTGYASVINPHEPKWKTIAVKEPYEILLDKVDPQNNNARIIYKGEAKDATVLNGRFGLAFIDMSTNYQEEFTNDGFITVLTITPNYLKSLGFPATLSRTIFSKMPSVLVENVSLGSSYLGFCKPL